MEDLLYSCLNRKEFSAISLFNKTHQILKDHHEQLSSELDCINCEMGIFGLDYIREYLLENKDSQFTTSCGVQRSKGFKYWARFEEPDDENESYKHFVQAEGNTLEEVAEKIATYLNSGKIYNDGRYI